MWFDTTGVYLTAGIATGKYPLSAFDGALRSACIADFNLKKVSSIVPPNIPVRRLSLEKVISGDGRLVPTIYESIASEIVGSRISVAVDVGVEKDSSGIIFTYSALATEAHVRKAVREMIKETMNAKGRPSYHCKIASTSSIVKAPWTCALAAAVFSDNDLESYFRPIVRKR